MNDISLMEASLPALNDEITELESRLRAARTKRGSVVQAIHFARLRLGKQAAATAAVAQAVAVRDAAQPDRAAKRFAECRADADAGGAGRHRLQFDDYEHRIIEDPAIPIAEAAARVGIFPFHAKLLRDEPPTKRK
jgi:hypothetical protein